MILKMNKFEKYLFNFNIIINKIEFNYFYNYKI